MLSGTKKHPRDIVKDEGENIPLSNDYKAPPAADTPQWSPNYLGNFCFSWGFVFCAVCFPLLFCFPLLLCFSAFLLLCCCFSGCLLRLSVFLSFRLQLFHALVFFCYFWCFCFPLLFCFSVCSASLASLLFRFSECLLRFSLF